jgi:hypothetical protein
VNNVEIAKLMQRPDVVTPAIAEAYKKWIRIVQDKDPRVRIQATNALKERGIAYESLLRWNADERAWFLANTEKP